MPDASQLDGLVATLRRERLADLGAIAPEVLSAVLDERRTAVGADSPDAYVEHLELHPDEYGSFFDALHAADTGAEAGGPDWRALATDVIPALVERRRADGPLRVWVVGCSDGAEAAMIAALLAAELGEDEVAANVKVYATDVDADVLSRARGAVHRPARLAGLPDAVRDAAFEPVDGGFRLRRPIARSIIFGRNDVSRDAPISRVDLLVCRGVLRYANAETQTEILHRLHFALRPDGILFIGAGDVLAGGAGLFSPADGTGRLLRRVDRGRRGARTDASQEGALAGLAGAALEPAPSAQLVVDTGRVLRLANRAARELLDLSRAQVNVPLETVSDQFAPLGLGGLVDRVLVDRREVRVDDVRFSRPGQDAHRLDVVASPLLDDGEVHGVSVLLLDVTARLALEAEAAELRRELETSYEELQSTVEELETTNEELQSTNEELETTNEELQSTNEELETMNEELHSANEELGTINVELSDRTAQVDESNVFLETILTSLRLGVIVLGRDLKVRTWNAQSTELWGLRREEAEGEHFLGLDIGLPVERLKPALREVLDEEAEQRDVRLEAVNRRGRAITVDVSVLRQAGAGDGVIVLLRDG